MLRILDFWLNLRFSRAPSINSKQCHSELDSESHVEDLGFWIFF